MSRTRGVIGRPKTPKPRWRNPQLYDYYDEDVLYDVDIKRRLKNKKRKKKKRKPHKRGYEQG